MKFLESVKLYGMRKMAWGLVALSSITALAFRGHLTGGEFAECFGILVSAVMAANYGEHKEKAKAETAAPAQTDVKS